MADAPGQVLQHRGHWQSGARSAGGKAIQDGAGGPARDPRFTQLLAQPLIAGADPLARRTAGIEQGSGFGHDRLHRQVVLQQLAEQPLPQHQVDRGDVVDPEMEQVAG